MRWRSGFPGRTDLAIANTMLSVSGQRLTGAANLDLSVAGTFSSPVSRAR